LTSFWHLEPWAWLRFIGFIQVSFIGGYVPPMKYCQLQTLFTLKTGHMVVQKFRMEEEIATLQIIVIVHLVIHSWVYVHVKESALLQIFTNSMLHTLEASVWGNCKFIHSPKYILDVEDLKKLKTWSHGRQTFASLKFSFRCLTWNGPITELEWHGLNTVYSAHSTNKNHF
jgi:hypothetical protein